MRVAIVFLILVIILGIILFISPNIWSILTINFLISLLFFLFFKKFLNYKKTFYSSLIFFNLLSLYVFDLLTIDRIILASTFFIALYWLLIK